MTWHRGPMVAVDLETTSPLPEEARIVSASIAIVDGSGLSEPNTYGWLVNPGVPIPEGATEIHGITNDRVRADGDDPRHAVAEILEVLSGRPKGAPIVVFNARYDLTVLDREARRHGLNPLGSGHDVFVVDPFVIDKWLHRYRKGKRTLEAMCEHYGARLDGAHDAAFDALAAARLAWVIGARGTVVRRVRGRQDAIELAALKREWDEVRDNLPALHEAQYRWAVQERVRFAEYKRSQGELEEAARIEAERGWPVLEVMPHESAAEAA